jgi:N-acetylglucosaminyl-diphospho-decaprenol L-rhamnosyltransferase
MRALTMPRLSIVVVTYNSRADVDACLASLARDRPAVDHEIVVVDNASEDGTADATRQRWPAARVLDAGSNIGFAAANNLGIRQTFGELVLLLNPDTIVPAGALDTLVGVLDRRADAAAVGPRLVDADGRAELSFGRMISPLAELRQKILVAGQDRRVPGLSHYVERATRRERTVDWVSGACLLVRRVDAEAVGLLDERYFMYAEDVDFCAALRARGRNVLFAPGAVVTHRRGRSAATARSATDRSYRRSQLAFYAKHHPGWVPFLRWYLRLRGRLP